MRLIRKDAENPLFDGLGSERTVTNSSQTVTGTLTFSAFGGTVSTTGAVPTPSNFGATNCYRNDGDAGLSHIGARYYDAQVGRFISRDTYLDQKPYLYCEHDPVNNVDPTGHQKKGKSWWENAGDTIGKIGDGIGKIAGGAIDKVKGVVDSIGKLLPKKIDMGGDSQDDEYHQGGPDKPGQTIHHKKWHFIVLWEK